ncbi:MAG: PD-(D/E)XK nuclease family protein, partial [Gammaproteobacteria bacterium]|nr:PD-(D/E)XK nuclease family protein [Gammaproteobacteria bacterium]
VQGSFVDAYRRHGLRAVLRQHCPERVGGLDAALGRLPERASPTTWIAIWNGCLKDIGWLGRSAFSAVAPVWDRALSRFAELTPVSGSLSLASALDEFGAMVRSQRLWRPPTRRGVHLLRRLNRIGPGYSAAWVAGFSDQAWPEPPEPNPLVPWSVRVAHGMPGASPKVLLEQARAEFERLRTRVAELVLSCPARLDEQLQAPNPIFADWETAASAADTLGTTGRHDARRWETCIDPAPALGARRIRGGARTLDLQSVCPVRAFCEMRLGGRELEPVPHGIEPWMRGLLIHRVLERWYEPRQVGSTARQPADPSRLSEALDEAFAEFGATGPGSWQRQLHAERQRLERILARFIEQEGARPEFEVVGVEQRSTIVIADHELSCRIDRIDRDGGGRQILIDYKTGSQLRTGWFDRRLSDAQLPLYAQQTDRPVAAVAAVLLGDSRIDYRAAGCITDVVPGKTMLFDESGWAAQLGTWRRQLSELITEFAAGDVRFQPSDAALADGAYAAVTRLRERMR